MPFGFDAHTSSVDTPTLALRGGPGLLRRSIGGSAGGDGGTASSAAPSTRSGALRHEVPASLLSSPGGSGDVLGNSMAAGSSDAILLAPGAGGDWYRPQRLSDARRLSQQALSELGDRCVCGGVQLA